MPVGRSRAVVPAGRLGRYPPFTYAMMPDGIVKALVDKRVGRNGWAVMSALCRRVYEDGKLGRASAREISAFTGLTAYQVARGMTDLREKGIIVPVIKKDADGRRWADRSVKGYVAQYCIDRDTWAAVELLSEGQTGGSGG